MIKSNNSIKRMSYIYIISLIPLILFGFYKNGISLYIKDYVNIVGMLKPLLFIIIGFLLGIIVNIIYEKIIHKEVTFYEKKNCNIVFVVCNIVS